MEQEDNFRCSICNERYPYKETANLCCRDRSGCGAKSDPNSILTSVCGKTISNGKWYFCKSCQRKKQNAWRTVRLK